MPQSVARAPRARFPRFVRGAVLAASLVLILAVTLTPTEERGNIELSDLDDLVDALGRADVRSTLGFIVEWAANVLLFLPFGAALALHGFSTTKTALAGLLVSTVVEGAQLLFVAGRTTSLDDVLLNSVGAVLGHALLSSYASSSSSDEPSLPRAE